MADPLLSTLCSICHINTPKYTCPRCSVNTCSLPCSRRHKLWSSCNGVRDPTVFVPRSQLATPSGIDHDYNFLHSIEHRKERSEKEIVENRRLVKASELKAARRGEDRRRPRNWTPEGEACINRILQAYRIKVYQAPSGMKRNVENTTTWSKKQRDINWQVEWIRDGDSGRLLEKALGFKRIGEAYYEAHEMVRRMNLTSAEKNIEKKRKLGQIKERYTKRMKLEHEGKHEMTTIPILQCPSTSAWNVPQRLCAAEVEEDQVPAWIFSLHFYLHRPNTPSTFPKVLIPLDSSEPLLDQLRKRELMEFPTIYVREQDTLPENCMLEKDFLRATGQEPTIPDEQQSSSSEEELDDDDTSTSGSDSSDNEMEEGEIH
ncbi:putative box C/D snoRNA protein [Lachnellula subtilissima]|uniref:Box C/D snoRNA protein 1 n=1 Tax=Lachnellula subtilissima TaxID=602034 RepID=A0A8H8RWG3_9HELO|nr:putative box C/D snoRNA protein [Lachnellula subtilissima]